jgi:prepilin-type N-terminal cleavage/methylation domain-containing protein
MRPFELAANLRPAIPPPLRATEGRAGAGAAAGFTLVELLIVIAIAAAISGMAVLVSPPLLKNSQADAGVVQVLDAFRYARELAVAQRRNVQIQFIGTNQIQIARVEIDSPPVTPPRTTVLRTVVLENRMQFLIPPGVPDTPDRFGAGSATAFGPSPARMFTSEATFIDNQGNLLNGTLFVAVPDDPTTARALSVMGATAFLRTWRWNGREWVE